MAVRATDFVWELCEKARGHAIEQRDHGGNVLLRAAITVGNPPRSVIPSPTDPLVVVSWSEQGEGGFDWFRIDSGFQHVPEWGYGEILPWILDAPVFSPDGRFLVACAGRMHWWREEQRHADTPRLCGRVIATAVGSGRYTTHDVAARVPAGWSPREQFSYEVDMLRPAEFVDATRFRVRDPVGQVHQFDVG